MMQGPRANSSQQVLPSKGLLILSSTRSFHSSANHPSTNHLVSPSKTPNKVSTQMSGSLLPTSSLRALWTEQPYQGLKRGLLPLLFLSYFFLGGGCWGGSQTRAMH